MAISNYTQKIIRKFCLITWSIWESLGVHVIPNHFYFPIRDSRKLKKYDFSKEIPSLGLKFDEAKMLDILNSFSDFQAEYLPLHNQSGYCSNGDGAILYSMIRRMRPKLVIEVGSGYSTQIIEKALDANFLDSGGDGRIIAVEPYPKQVLRQTSQESDRLSIHEMFVEDLNESFFDQLGDGDLLFIDSSHVLDIANDVHYLYLKILPRIAVGVTVHIHDIRLPHEYPKEWVLTARKYWTEQYLLLMFLSFNSSFEITFASNFIYQKNPKKTAEALVGLDSNTEGWPGSFWIKRIT